MSHRAYQDPAPNEERTYTENDLRLIAAEPALGPKSVEIQMVVNDLTVIRKGTKETKNVAATPDRFLRTQKQYILYRGPNILSVSAQLRRRDDPLNRIPWFSARRFIADKFEELTGVFVR